MRYVTILLLVTALVPLGHADIITLRDGTVINGMLLGADQREVRVLVGDQAQTLAAANVVSIVYGETPIATPAGESRGDTAGIPIPAGTTITVLTIDSINSESADLGQTFLASLAEPIIVDGQTLVSQNDDAVLRLIETKKAGRFRGNAELSLVLVSVGTGEHLRNVQTAEATVEGDGKGSGTATKVGVGAAVGAALGGIFGGGKGAATGAAAGAGAGAGVAAMTKGPNVFVDSETRLTFIIQ